MSAIIRLATESDADKMLAIYTPVVLDTAISFELEPPTEDEFRERIRNTLKITPWLACEMDGEIAGYAYAGQYRPRPAYQWSVEVTVYVNASFRRRGVARALYTSLFECLRVQGYHSAYAAVALPNPASIAVHENMGFKSIGIFHSVGYKHGKWHDSGWWELSIQPGVLSPRPPQRLPDAVNTHGFQEAIQKGLSLLRS